jgi:hypothetical protein
MGTRKTRTPNASPLEAVTQLVAERAKYEQWLEDLEAKKDATPTKVFDRVRQDYLTRLQSVMEQLKQHTQTLQAHAASLMKRLRELEAAEEVHNEEQAEAALRKQVGEISTQEWDSASRRAQKELAKLKEDQELVANDLNQIREILGGESDTDEAPKRSADFDELEFLKSVVGVTPPGSSTPPGPSKTAAAEPKPDGKSAPKSEPKAQTPASTPAVTADKPPAALPPEKPAETNAPDAPAAAASPPPAAASPPSPAATPSAAAPAVPAKKAGMDTPLKVPVTPDGPLNLRSSGVTEQPKTLKCAECGAMNYPSEWYCERCGAELSVL